MAWRAACPSLRRALNETLAALHDHQTVSFSSPAGEAHLRLYCFSLSLLPKSLTRLRVSIGAVYQYLGRAELLRTVPHSLLRSFSSKFKSSITTYRQILQHRLPGSNTMRTTRSSVGKPAEK
eukprot:scaffold120132_cov17-Prasinocladus_malaysianus.AAC.1